MGFLMLNTASEPVAPGTVSVIMIFFNAERFIDEAIASVFAQTYPHWELLLIDDGSQDGSTAIARRYAASHPGRVRYLEHPGHVNLGRSAARNLGLAAARGDYLAFLDADDMFLPERLARHVTLLERHSELDVVQSRFQLWYSWQQRGPRLDVDHVSPSIEPYQRVIAPPICLSLLLAVPEISPGLNNLTLRREWALRTCGFEDRFDGLFDDTVFFAKMYLRGRIQVIPDVLARYRRHADSCTRRNRGATHTAARLAFISWLDEHVSAFEGTDPGSLQALKAQLALAREAAGQPSRTLKHRLVAFTNGLMMTALPIRAYLALVRLRRTSRERSAARRVAELMAAGLGDGA
jgi:glycosyltransferase involved in cell wall biosynthesis